MKRFVLSVMILMCIAGSGFGDVLDPFFFSRRERTSEGRLSVDVSVSELEENTLMFRMSAYGRGTYSYKIINADAGEVIYSESDETYGETSVGRTWKYDNPEEGKSVIYMVKASFKPIRASKTTLIKYVTVRNVKGIINVEIE